ncbi:hypothetical protein K505DRAFT_356188 [Melanomma pulvis-pyrius CBS 109.77]|uniref:SET domain-containing protein n=1 Tax=Melanomma pulvis-pyrius CBS 109.77 TaxID=1314802 RepID=A0A6A6XVY5_9PLEO|nr:hypothetical protein K505DRAFT_356188 [Melanomma pulvis-pyrius CBS 109.77]
MQPNSKNSQWLGSQADIPEDWPAGTVYLRAPYYSKKLAEDAFKTLVFPKSDLPSSERALTTRPPYSNIKISKILSPNHPANGQHGLFARLHLPPDSFIISYLGYVHDQNDIDETSDYDLSLDRDFGIGVDASRIGNEARFINDYRSVVTSPNAEFRDIFVDIGDGKIEKRMGVFVLSAGKSGKRAKGIPKGCEIVVSYGKGFWTERLKMDR